MKEGGGEKVKGIFINYKYEKMSLKDEAEENAGI
jgi:hypothetical protein